MRPLANYKGAVCIYCIVLYVTILALLEESFKVRCVEIDICVVPDGAVGEASQEEGLDLTSVPHLSFCFLSDRQKSWESGKSGVFRERSSAYEVRELPRTLVRNCTVQQIQGAVEKRERCMPQTKTVSCFHGQALF